MFLKVLYLGDFIKCNGPAHVDQRLKKKLHKDVFFIQSNDFRTLHKDIQALMRVDVCHVSGVSAKGVILFILCVLFRIKRTFTMHGFLAQDRQFRSVNRYRLWIEMVLIALSNEVYTVSKKLKEQIGSKYDFKFHVIPNGVSLNAPFDIECKNKNLIVCVGGGRPEKNILSVCHAVELINEKHNKNLELVVVGEDGRDSVKIREFKCVNYLGFIHPVELNALLLDAKIFIQYSYFESFSLAIFEALNQGCYVISSDQVGALEYVEGLDCIISVKIDSLEELVNSILLTLERSNLESVEFELGDISWESVSNKYLTRWRRL